MQSISAVWLCSNIELTEYS